MAKEIKAIQLSDGIILTKPALIGELLVRVNKKNIFLEVRDDGFFWVIILPDKECYWDWFNESKNGRSLTGNSAFSRRENSNIIKVAPCIERLIRASATRSPREFMPVIKQLDEEKIVEELEKLAVLYGK